MNKKMKHAYALTKSRSIIFPILVGWFLYTLLLCGNAFSGSNDADLLMTPSEKVEKVERSILMDVVVAGQRMVAVGERGHIIYSDDGGSNWVQAEVPVSVTLTAVYFPSPQKGWVVGHEGVVLYTKDSGKTWEKQLDGVKINEIMADQLRLMIKKRTELLENGSSGLTQEKRSELETQKENLSFFLGDVEAAMEEGPTRPLMDVWFRNDREGIVIGSFGIILATEDGGTTWRSLLEGIDNTEGHHLYGITRSGNDLFIAGEAGEIYRSEDFGKTWRHLASPYEGSYFGIIGDPAGGFVAAFGLRGNLFYSVDRGETWLSSNSHREMSISGGAFLPGGTAFFVAVDGALLNTSNRGKTFNLLSQRFPGAISVAGMKTGVVTVVGLKGAIQVNFDETISRIDKGYRG